MYAPMEMLLRHAVREGSIDESVTVTVTVAVPSPPYGAERSSVIRGLTVIRVLVKMFQPYNI